MAAAGPVVWQEEDGSFRMVYSAIGTRWGYYSICYAESDDAVHWRKPELGLHDFRGSKANNIVMVGGKIGKINADPGQVVGGETLVRVGVDQHLQYGEPARRLGG